VYHQVEVEDAREGETSPNDGGDIDQYLNELDVEIDALHDDLLLLMESDIPGASLHNRDPAELNVVQ